MKPEDLMLGDYIQVEFNDSEKQIVQVDKLSLIGIYSEGSYLTGAKLTPIEITEEFLFKNGFTFDVTDIYYHLEYYIDEDNKITIVFDKHKNLVNSNNNCFIHIDNSDCDTIFNGELSYVHELQHVLKYCKIEKQIIC